MNSVNASASLTVVRSDSPALWQGVLAVRQRVFADEQSLVDLGISDNDDRESLVLVALLDGRPVATGRLTPPGAGRAAYLSWIATLPEHRHRGIATRLVERLVAASDDRGYPELQLAAQTHAIGLYEQFGFVRFGQPYIVRGIQHQAMIRTARLAHPAHARP